ncbi:hypothetical protein BJ996_006959 [Streptomyces phaeogriseichromatogenes]|nr:hypothetical protein [Streptomyces murinus]
MFRPVAAAYGLANLRSRAPPATDPVTARQFAKVATRSPRCRSAPLSVSPGTTGRCRSPRRIREVPRAGTTTPGATASPAQRCTLAHGHLAAAMDQGHSVAIGTSPAAMSGCTAGDIDWLIQIDSSVVQDLSRSRGGRRHDGVCARPLLERIRALRTGRDRPRCRQGHLVADDDNASRACLRKPRHQPHRLELPGARPPRDRAGREPTVGLVRKMWPRLKEPRRPSMPGSSSRTRHGFSMAPPAIRICSRRVAALVCHKAGNP